MANYCDSVCKKQWLANTKREYFGQSKFWVLKTPMKPSTGKMSRTAVETIVEDCIICYSFHDDPSKLNDRGEGYTVKFSVWVFLFPGLHLESLTTTSAGLYFSLMD